MAFPYSGRTACGGGGISSLLPPSVTFLRSYWASFNAPTRVATDSSGNIYITDPIKGEVLVRAPNGRIVSRVKGFNYPLSIAVEEGRIYVGDGVTGSVTAFAPDWQRLFLLGQGEGEFLMPNDIAIDSATGNVYVADSKADLVKVYSSSGEFLWSFGGLGSGDGQFNFPVGIFINSTANEVLVVDQFNFRIQIFDLNGNFLFCFGAQGNTPGKFNMPQDVWVDGQGRIYVTDTFEGRIQVLDRNGAFIGYIGEFGEGPGQFRIPVDMVIDPFNRLFVTSANNARMEVFGLDSFTDPESIVPAVIDIQPDPLAQGGSGVVIGHIEVPGYPLDQIAISSIVANGVHANLSPISTGDYDSDAVPDLRVEFDRVALMATLPPEGQAIITVTGSIGNKQFEGSDIVQVVPDSDGDGVPDEKDLCPDTHSGDVVNVDGCSINQLCPCAGPIPGVAWKKHKNYVSCVAVRANEFLEIGLITQEAKDAIVRKAATSTCGKRTRKEDWTRR